MTKFCVKKPFYVVVAVIVILVIGIVSLTGMQTDLMPNLSMPYLAVITTEVGASPEQVEMDVTEPLENALGTINGVENVTSSSSENYGMVMLEFAEDTDMEAALVRVSMALDSLELPEECGTPNIMEISVDMLATMYASVDYEGKDIKEVTNFTKDAIVPYLERQNGVASISSSGEVSDSVEIRLNQKKIDKVNEKILEHTNEKLADAAKEIEEAKADLADGEAELKKQKANLEKQQNDTNQELADASVQLSQAQATKAAYESSYNSLKASQNALLAEKQAYEDAGMQKTYDQLDGMFAQFAMNLGTTAEQAGMEVPASIEEAAADEVMERILSVDGIAEVGAMDGNASAITSVAGGKDNYTQFSFHIITEPDIKTTDEFHAICEEIAKKTSDVKDAQIHVSSSALGEMSSLIGSGIEVDIYGDDQDQLIAISKDIKAMLEETEGLENIDDGLANADSSVRLSIDRNKAAACGLTSAQILQTIAARTTTNATAITMKKEGVNLDVKLVNETEPLTYENLMDMELEVDTTNDDGEAVTKTYQLSKFATMTVGTSMDTITRENQSRYMTVKADVKDGYNATLLSRTLQEKLDAYQAPEGYTVGIGGESEQVMEMVWQMLKALALGALLVYLVMVAQFQSLLSPFIIIFTIPLAFTGGMLGLAAFGKSISAMSLMGFMILMGTVVNNGIVFVDYANQLRIAGVDKRTALIATGKTRMRPILMTAMTTILSMSVMVFSQDAGNAMQRGMSIVVAAGLIYATFMTLFIVPVMYDIFYRKQPRVIDVGDDLDEIPDETSELINQLREV